MQFVSRCKAAAIFCSQWVLLLACLGAGVAQSTDQNHTAQAGRPVGMSEKVHLYSEQGYILQLAAHRFLVNAQRALRSFDAPDADIVKTTTTEGDMFLVVSGSYSDRTVAGSAAKTFSTNNPGANYWVRPATDLIFLLGDSYKLSGQTYDTPSQKTVTSKPSGSQDEYTIQISADRNRLNSERALARLNVPGAEIVKVRDVEGELYLLLYGRYADKKAAQKDAEKLAVNNSAIDYWVRTFTAWPDREQSPTLQVQAEAAQAKVKDSLAQDSRPRARPTPPAKKVNVKLDEIWAEYGHFTDRLSEADHQGYIRSSATANWWPNKNWELQLSGRLDGYYQWGDWDSDKFEADFGETYIRYNSNDLRVTLGAQKVVWGRIDEFPPVDRMSTQDLSRFVLDELADRRRAGAALRIEHFSENGKLDFVYLPWFRAAELPEEESIWFPIDQRRGEVFGLRSTALTSALVKNATLELDEPDSDGGAGVRYTGMTANTDFGLSIQRVRHNTPYFTYDPSTLVIEDIYPRSWILGGDLGMEAFNGVLRFEMAWLSDTPVTTPLGEFSTVESINWGGSYEFFPGDGDARINIQLMGSTLFNNESVLDRTEDYSLSGSFETPFSHNRWRFNTRFYLGLREKDYYINPELAYIGWPSQELYIEAHYFDGDDGTPGGFHQNHSMISSGWRIKF